MAETVINKKQVGSGIWTEDNLIAGNNISISKIQKPEIDEHTLGVWHLDNNADNAVQNSVLSTDVSSFLDTQYRFGAGCARNADIVFNSSVSTSLTKLSVDFWALLYSPNPNGRNFFSLGRPINLPSFSVYCSASKIWFGNEIAMEPSTWHHFAFTFEAENSRMKCILFLDGKKYDNNVYVNLSSLNIADYYKKISINGYEFMSANVGSAGALIDEVRISDSIRWTEDFTPFSEPYAVSGGTPQYQINNTQDISGKLENTASGANALTIAGTAATTTQSHNIGDSSSADIYGTSLGYSAAAATAGTAIGTRATAGNYAIAIGSANGASVNTEASGASSIAVGYNAKATANTAIQIGTGTNSTAGTVQIKNTQILDANGKIPSANLDTTVPAVDQSYSATSPNAQSGAAVAEALNGKADTDLSNVPSSKGILVESYVNGTSWYRVYSDGWCEQGGVQLSSEGNAAPSITFLKPFLELKYLGALIEQADTTAYTTTIHVYGATNTEVRFSTRINGTGAALTFYWQASGYIN